MTFRSILQALACFATLAMLSACAGGGHVSATDEAKDYAAHAKRNYTPPGPPGDPWGPYIIEASGKYDVPERWVREVIRQESGGRQYQGNQLIISSAGAMGLMQVMPATYDELRARYGLGDDPYDPHDNILAGTAYLRELYDLYGSPGFLAAYNAGPGRLEDYLTRNRALPDETRKYVARIGANLGDSQPERPTSAQYAMTQIPVNIPPGPRYPRGRYTAPVMLADNRERRSGSPRGSVQMASLEEPVRPIASRSPQPALASYIAPAAPSRSGFHLVAPAMAEPMPLPRGGTSGGTWAIQVGAFGNEGMARAAMDSARQTAREQLSGARPAIGTVRQPHATLYRARLTGLSRESAVQACDRLTRSRANCIVLSPAAQS